MITITELDRTRAALDHDHPTPYKLDQVRAALSKAADVLPFAHDRQHIREAVKHGPDYPVAFDARSITASQALSWVTRPLGSLTCTLIPEDRSAFLQACASEFERLDSELSGAVTQSEPDVPAGSWETVCCNPRCKKTYRTARATSRWCSNACKLAGKAIRDKAAATRQDGAQDTAGHSSAGN